jgi:PIN domain nuclease of toxin-antitoxin system
MRLLLDTHAFLWATQEPVKLSDIAREAILDLQNEIFVSSISGYEISNKHRLGKLPGFEAVIEAFPSLITRLQARELPVSAQHAVFAGSFQWQHRDPFDRILAAQASCDGLLLVTTDHVFGELSWVETLW